MEKQLNVSIHPYLFTNVRVFWLKDGTGRLRDLVRSPLS